MLHFKNMVDKKESLTELIQSHNPIKPKRKSLIHEHFLNGKTEEEIKAWHKAAGEKRKAIWAEKKAKQKEIEAKAEDLAPRLLAEQIIQEASDKENWTPTQKTINDFKFFAKQNITMEELRVKHFSSMTDDMWHALLKFAFKSQIANPEDLGADILKSKQKGRNDLVKQQREINKQIKAYKEEKKTKIIPAYLLQMKMDLTREIVKQEQDLAKTLHQIGAVGEKSKAPSLHIHVKTPRPEKLIKDVISE